MTRRSCQLKSIRIKCDIKLHTQNVKVYSAHQNFELHIPNFAHQIFIPHFDFKHAPGTA